MASVEDTRLMSPEMFDFPFEPYYIQISFMKALFEALEEKKLGIFESPTGTGKSLSLLCGMLTWLKERETQRLSDLRKFLENSDIQAAEKEANEATNWIVSLSAFRSKREKFLKVTRELKFMEEGIERRKKFLQRRKERQRLKSTFPISFPKLQKGTGLQDSESSSAVDLMDELTDVLLNEQFAPYEFSDSDYSDEDDDDEMEEHEFYQTKIIYASRTHSQLGQFINEFKKTSFTSEVTSVCLGSRQNMCINPDVNRLKNLSLINERCLDLQKTKKGKTTTQGKKQKTGTGCPFFNQPAIEELKSQILSEPLDIEELVKAGKTTKACPYYASRKASKEAQLILTPYNTILHTATREAIKLRTKNSVVILDEAHNIIESIANMYTTQMTMIHLQECLQGLKTYMNRYLKCFSTRNLLKLKQILHVLKCLITLLSQEQSTGKVFFVQEFIVAAGIEELDLFSLLKYVLKSKLAFKLKGYLQLQERQVNLEGGVNSNVTVTEDENKKSLKSLGQGILLFVELMKAVTRSGGSGKIIHEGHTLKFLLLNTSDHFSDIVKSARSIILSGGTMKPYEDIEDQLFHGFRDRLFHFSCGHVIPNENLLCLAVTRGPTLPFEFTFRTRDSTVLLQDLCLSVLDISRVVPAGLVIFLPSYDVEEKFYKYLQQSGILEKIESTKKVFREPKESGETDQILLDYGRRIKRIGGAILLAVIGGKLSEGINFSDDLGRCVIVVGLPYPNIKSIEIQEKVKFVNEKFGQGKGNQLLKNSCFKAVNQCIGRAIRHSQDYAAIILLDGRYNSNDSQNQLPEWIRSKYQSCSSFSNCISSLSQFFSTKV